MAVNQQGIDDEERIRRSYPFVQIEGVSNFRDVGGYRSAMNSGMRVRKGLVFRSGELSKVTDKGKERLMELGVRKVFDLRSDREVEKYGIKDVEVEGITFERVGVAETVWYDPISLGLRLQGYANDEVNTFANSYKKLMKDFAGSYEKIIRHIVDHPDEACVVHCTAGKDRTGVFVALLLMLLGVLDEDIADDYGLSTIGLKPFLPTLMARFEAQELYKANWAGTLNMGRSNPESMRKTIKTIREEYGSAEAYFLKMTGLDEETLARMKEMLLEPGDASRLSNL